MDYVCELPTSDTAFSSKCRSEKIRKIRWNRKSQCAFYTSRTWQLCQHYTKTKGLLVIILGEGFFHAHWRCGFYPMECSLLAKTLKSFFNTFFVNSSLLQIVLHILCILATLYSPGKHLFVSTLTKLELQGKNCHTHLWLLCT